MSKFKHLYESSESAVRIFLAHDKTVLGRLVYTPGSSVRLTYTDEDDPISALANTAERYPLLLGQFANGPYFTLLNSFITNTSFGGAGVVERELISNQLLVGMHLTDIDSKFITKTQVSLTDLTAWFGFSAISSECAKLESPNRGSRYTQTVRHYPQIGFTPVVSRVTLENEQVIGQKGDLLGAATLTNSFELCLSRNGMSTLETALDDVFMLQTFLSVLCGKQQFINRLKLVVPNGKGGHDEVYFVSHVALPKSNTRLRIPEVLFPLTAIREVIPELWAEWTEGYAKYQTAIDLYVSTDIHEGQLLNFQYLAILQAIETLHRNCRAGTYMPKGQYESLYQGMATSIPVEIAGSHRESMKSRLKYGNEYSLRKRLFEFYEVLGQQERDLLHPELKIYLSKVVDTRNYLTHYSDESRKEAFSNEEQVWSVRIMRWFFVAVLLHELGMPARNIVDVLKNSRELRYARERAEGLPVDHGVVIEDKRKSK